jgi:uncharacterized protein (TIGR02611 family)
MSERPKFIERLLARREQHQERHIAFRILWGIAGTLVLIGGLIMLVTPGPAFVLIPVGLAMLALEFEWAERLLERALIQAEKARDKAAATSTWQKIAGGVLAVGAIAGAAVVALVVL